ncbi:MAG: hypothetical protein RIT27_1403 [Pseudomonadota bacterium]
MKIQLKKMYLMMAGAALLGNSAVQACGPDSYLGSICLTAATFCPRGTFEANGQQLSISQNSALYSLLGATYGGDGRTTFGLPDLRGRVPVGVGQGRGLTNVNLGETRGFETITLTVPQLPVHYHSQTVVQSQNPTNATTPDAVLANVATTAPANTDKKIAINNNNAIGNTGAGAPVPTIPPQLGMRYCIVSNGIYPSRD